MGNYLSGKMKRVVVFLVLFSMVLHCSVRLGLATWLYQNRQEIAYAFGLIEEPPITMCSHEDDLDRAITIEVSADDQSKAPRNSFQASEINLFLSYTFLTNTPQFTFLRENGLLQLEVGKYSSPDPDIFHPPSRQV